MRKEFYGSFKKRINDDPEKDTDFTDHTAWSGAFPRLSVLVRG